MLDEERRNEMKPYKLVRDFFVAVTMDPYRQFEILLAAIILVLLTVVAGMNQNSKFTLSIIAVIGTLIILSVSVNFELTKKVGWRMAHVRVPVLLQNFRGRQWYAMVEIDADGRLSAPADPKERILTPTEVSKDIHILRAPHYKEGGRSVTMLGAVYQIPRVPFGE